MSSHVICTLRALLITAVALAWMFAAHSASAGTAGQVKGKVIDSESKQPVEVATVSEVNKAWGGSTDLDGEFIIINVRPGLFTVEISHVGYHTVTVEDVYVAVDLTTDLGTIELTSEAEKLPDVKIKYEKPDVQLTQTFSGDSFTREKMSNLKVEGIEDMIRTTTGFKIDQEGKWHVRGGRSADVAVIYDGVDFRDPMVDTQIRVDLSSESVQSVDVLTGGFNPEYGRAMGAIIQITSAEGPIDHYTGKVEYQSDRVIDAYSFDTDRMELAFGGPVPYTTKWLGKPVTFYFQGTGRLTNTYVPFDVSRENSDYLGIGVNLPERQYNDYQSSLNLAYNLTDKRKLSLNLKETYRLWDIYPEGEGGISGNAGYDYRYNLENRPWAENRQFAGTLTFTNQLTSKSFYELKFITFRTRSKVQPRSKTPGDFTLLDEIEDNFALAVDRNQNGYLDQDEYSDNDGNGFMDGFMDANGNGIFDGGGEGYEDLNYNGRWDRGEDWVDLNGNGRYDAAEPWIDVVNPLTGENNLGIWDPWDSYTDLNGNGRWDPAEPQLAEHDWNRNGRWDGERFIDANGNGRYDPWEPWSDLNGNYRWDPGEPFIDTNGNGKFDYGEGYDDKNQNGMIDRRDILPRTGDYWWDTGEPFIDGDYWWDTGEPFIDEPDPISGAYNGRWDPGEIWFDLPSSSNFQTGAGLYYIGTEMTLNGRYDGPNFLFDEYELFTMPAQWNFNSNKSRPVQYNFDEEARGTDWPADLFIYHPGKSTWINRTLHDQANPGFDMRDFSVDETKEWFQDYNGNGKWDPADYFINPGLWDGRGYWEDRTSTEYSVKFDYQNQVSKFHLMKTGVELKYRDLEMQKLEQPDLRYNGEAELPEGSPWPDRGGIRDFYRYRPWEGAAYVQDKMEFEGLIVNAGLRWDFILHDGQMIDEFRQKVIRDEPGAVISERSKYRLSPRLGISHPITAQSKLYFNYGHFYQAPKFTYFYRAATANVEVSSIIGNPNLEYEKTIQYELGVNTKISEFVIIDISGYYKDQYDLISTEGERWKNLSLNRYANIDYGRMRGFEFSIEKKPANHYALTFNYDFSYAFGKASDQHASVETRLNNVPDNYDEHPLDWDETHKINAYMTILYDRNDHPRLFGLVLPDDWMMTLQWEFGSGVPYTPSRYTTGIENANLILDNSARVPWHENTTLKFEKYYSLGRGDHRLLLGLTADNLFNKRNVQSVYAETGSPTEAVHPENPSYNPFDNRQEHDANPRNFSAGRNILFRVGMTF